ncbi:MAG: OB-fold domain-containing protein, partial [Minicystis sp.]
IRTASGQVLVPPTEYDPVSGEALSDFVAVGEAGVVTTWAWITEPRPGQPFNRPFAWALIRLDGADTGLLHAVDVPGPEHMRTGMRVTVRWRAERVGGIGDIACFEPEPPR